MNPIAKFFNRLKPKPQTMNIQQPAEKHVPPHRVNENIPKAAAYDPWRECLSAPQTFELPTAPRLDYGVLTFASPERLQRLGLHTSSRPGWIVRFAQFGQMTLIGATQDADVDSGESGIIYGLIDRQMLQRTELACGASLEGIYESTTQIEVILRSFPEPRCLLWLAAPEHVRGYSVRVESHCEGNLVVDQQAKASAAVILRRGKALSLRDRWPADKQGFPSWAQPWIVEVVQAGPTPPPPPPPDRNHRRAANDW